MRVTAPVYIRYTIGPAARTGTLRAANATHLTEQEGQEMDPTSTYVLDETAITKAKTIEELAELATRQVEHEAQGRQIDRTTPTTAGTSPGAGGAPFPSEADRTRR